VIYEIENGEDSMFAKLPPFLQSKIRESDEFTRRTQEPALSRDEISDYQHADNEGDGSDLPF
jgi:hypothetical protein